MDTTQRQLKELSYGESLELLGTVPVGRIVFSLRALPAVRVVNHVVDEGAVIIRSHEGAAIVPAVGAGPGAVVAYEADALDEHRRLGWSVVVTGVASLVDDPVAIERYGAILHPWVLGRMDQVIRIDPHLVTGFRLVPVGDGACL
ncbi:MAG: pyridoxamine 5'-phosphate oxidase family protein [Streptosporangiales bacterium]|nr:pyridoxamine 5'-phosphate oxidase family protein [Streptosporangiales bacterium]